MMDWLKKESSVPNGPDFGDIDSESKAVTRMRAGELERLFLLPLEFGGTDVRGNVVYVPLGIAAIKANIDRNIIGPLVAEGKITEYHSTPEYQGRSFVPTAIKIVASTPGSFTTMIRIWGRALEESDKA